MTGQEAHFEDLISAYLDDEVSSEERYQVERLLASSAKHRRYFAALQTLRHELQHLPRYRLGPHVTQQIIARVDQLGLASDSLGAGSSATSHDDIEEFDAELLSAYLDGELSNDERLRVERRLRASPVFRGELEQLEILDRSLRSLPEVRLDGGFADRVLRRIEQQQATRPHREVQPAQRPTAAKWAAGWRGFISAAITVAAALLVTAYAFNAGERRTSEIAVSRPPPRPTGVQSQRPDELRPSPSPKPGAEIVQQPGPKAPTLPATPDTSAWALVHAVQKQTRLKLLMVYEVSVTPEGVAQAAFANLLRRHGIRFYQTLPVGEQEQRALLKHRFLDGVQIDKDATAPIDEVQLFLVSCMGRQADEIWLDLTNRPAGFGSAWMNLTTREAGDDGVLNKLCEASGIEKRSGQAVELLGSFAILSRTARNLGVFGSIKWVDPNLLEPAGNKSRKEPAGKAQPAEADEAADDFPCELLFVVRNLQPLTDSPAQKSR
jgi:anti-sigma factor RsiW